MTGFSTTDFARQLAQRNAEIEPGQPKKFRSSLAPKGTKLAAGYKDRTKLRVSNDEDEKVARVTALEDMVKLGQLDEATFEKLRDEIVGGDLQRVHLVKGLDYKLLERTRRAMHEERSESSSILDAELTRTEGFTMETPDPGVNLEEELDKLEAKTTEPLQKAEKLDKIGMMAPPKRKRDDILKELRAGRVSKPPEKVPVQPALGDKFRRIGARREESRMEKDAQGQEVLISVDANGNVKRKVKRPKSMGTAIAENGLLELDKNAAPLGIEIVPSRQLTPPQSNDLDIFEDVGNEFNPLGRDADSSDDESANGSENSGPINSTDKQPAQPEREKDPYREKESHKLDTRQNYFNEADASEAATDSQINPLSDPTILAALKKASSIQAESPELRAEAKKLAQRQKLLEAHDRDADDMDLGFGGSRLDDEEDGEGGKRVKLSIWGEEKGHGEGNEGRREKRKRGPKKSKKGDGENVADVMRVLERRKGNKE